MSLWQCGPCPADCQRPTLLLSWTLAVALSCLAAGLMGLLQPVSQPIVLQEMSSHADTDTQGEIALLEMAAPAPEAAAEISEVVEKTTVLETLPALIEVVPETLDLPEPLELLTEADLVEIDPSPPLEVMLTPAQPAAPRPPAPVIRSSNTPSASSTPPRASSTNSGMVGGTPGGSGASTTGASKSYFPSPPYPAAARSRGMQGTVYLSITFGSDGRVTGASVARSSGYSELDRAASDWVRRTWRAASGQSGTFRQPVHFRLR